MSISFVNYLYRLPAVRMRCLCVNCVACCEEVVYNREDEGQQSCLDVVRTAGPGTTRPGNGGLDINSN